MEEFDISLVTPISGASSEGLAGKHKRPREELEDFEEMDEDEAKSKMSILLPEPTLENPVTVVWNCLDRSDPRKFIKIPAKFNSTSEERVATTNNKLLTRTQKLALFAILRFCAPFPQMERYFRKHALIKNRSRGWTAVAKLFSLCCGHEVVINNASSLRRRWFSICDQLESEPKSGDGAIQSIDLEFMPLYQELKRIYEDGDSIINSMRAKKMETVHGSVLQTPNSDDPIQKYMKRMRFDKQPVKTPPASKSPGATSPTSEIHLASSAIESMAKSLASFLEASAQRAQEAEKRTAEFQKAQLQYQSSKADSEPVKLAQEVTTLKDNQKRLEEEVAGLKNLVIALSLQVNALSK